MAHGAGGDMKVEGAWGGVCVRGRDGGPKENYRRLSGAAVRRIYVGFNLARHLKRGIVPGDTELVIFSHIADSVPPFEIRRSF